jgi:hypothetical protein
VAIQIRWGLINKIGRGGRKEIMSDKVSVKGVLIFFNQNLKIKKTIKNSMLYIDKIKLDLYTDNKKV